MPLSKTAIGLISQLEAVVSQLSPSQYSEPIPALSGATVGQHVRHTLEFFLCLMDGQREGKINYDTRKHDPYIEQDAPLAMSVMHTIREFLRWETEDMPLELEASYDTENEDAVRLSSTFYRELAYNIEHTIHHMALIRVGLKANFPQVAFPEHFGVASSTVRHLKKSEPK